MIDFDKMTVAEHEQYKEMQRKAEGWDSLKDSLSIASEHMKRELENRPNYISNEYAKGQADTLRNTLRVMNLSEIEEHERID